MCYWVLIESGNYIARSTVIPILSEEESSTLLKERMEKFDANIHDVIGNHKNAII